MVRIYVSGTYEDLRDYHQAVVKQLDKLRSHGVEVIYSPYREENDPEVSYSDLESCQLYLGIIGHRYGTTPRGGTRSVTQWEYERALESGDKEMLVYVADEEHVFLPIKFYEEPQVRAKQTDFRNTISGNASLGNRVRVFKSPQDLASQLAVELPILVRSFPGEVPDITIFGVDSTELDHVYTTVDRTHQERLTHINSLLLFMSESFASLFSLDANDPSVHPLVRAVGERLRSFFASGIHLVVEDGLLTRVGVRHVILRTETLFSLVRGLPGDELLRIGRGVGRSAALDLVKNTLKQAKFVPASPEAFMALWNFWESTGGWGRLELLPERAADAQRSTIIAPTGSSLYQVGPGTLPISDSPDSSEWYIRIDNNFLNTGHADETRRLCSFWCGYLFGFLDEALPQITNLMRDLNDEQSGRVTFPPYRRVESVTLQDGLEHESVFHVRFKRELLSDAFTNLSMSEHLLQEGKNGPSLSILRQAIQSMKAVLRETKPPGYFDQMLQGFESRESTAESRDAIVELLNHKVSNKQRDADMAEQAHRLFRAANLFVQFVWEKFEDESSGHSQSS